MATVETFGHYIRDWSLAYSFTCSQSNILTGVDVVVADLEYLEVGQDEVGVQGRDVIET